MRAIHYVKYLQEILARLAVRGTAVQKISGVSPGTFNTLIQGGAVGEFSQRKVQLALDGVAKQEFSMGINDFIAQEVSYKGRRLTADDVFQRADIVSPGIRRGLDMRGKDAQGLLSGTYGLSRLQLEQIDAGLAFTPTIRAIIERFLVDEELSLPKLFKHLDEADIEGIVDESRPKRKK